MQGDSTQAAHRRQPLPQQLLRAARERRPLVIGHRGFPATCVENTLDSFRAAIEAGADGVELDVQLSREGVPVVYHDETLTRLAARPDRIVDLTVSELAQVAVSRDGREAVGIPTLDAVLEIVAQTRRGGLAATILPIVDVELKSYPSTDRRALRAAVRAVLSRHTTGVRCFLSSFDPRLMRGWGRWPTSAIWCDSPEVPRVLRRGFGMVIGGSTIAKPGHRDIPVGISLLRRPTLVWTVNDRAAAIAMLDAGAAGLIGDDPAALIRWRAEWLAGERSGPTA